MTCSVFNRRKPPRFRPALTVKKIGSVPTKANPGIPGEKSVPLQAVYIESIRISVK